jgi:hypothetical protein
VAVAAIYGTVTHLTGSILPAVVLHTGGNLYSNLDLWLHGRAEWQAAPGTSAGANGASGLAFGVATAVTVGCFVLLARATTERRRAQATLSAAGGAIR